MTISPYDNLPTGKNHSPSEESMPKEAQQKESAQPKEIPHGETPDPSKSSRPETPDPSKSSRPETPDPAEQDLPETSDSAKSDRREPAVPKAPAKTVSYVEVDPAEIASSVPVPRSAEPAHPSSEPAPQSSEPAPQPVGSAPRQLDPAPQPAEPAPRSSEPVLQPAEPPKPAVSAVEEPSATAFPERNLRDPAKGKPLEQTPRYTTLALKNRHTTEEFLLPFEESLLVPDVMPDIKDILFAEGKINLAQPGKTTYRKGDLLSGDLTVYTVYLPDQKAESPVDVVKSTVPFKTEKCWEASSASLFKAELRILELDAQLINERKFIAKGTIAITITPISQKELAIFKGIDDQNFRQLEDRIQITDLDFELEDSTEITQEINGKEEDPHPVKILKSSIRISESHKQITAEKLVINGTIHSQILYLGEEDGESKLCCLTNKTDFAQFLPLKGEKNIDLIKVSFIDEDLQITLDQEGHFLLEGRLRTQACGYQNIEVKVVTDAYHKEKELSLDTSSLPLFQVKGTVCGEISTREVVNLMDSQEKPEKLLCGFGQLKEITGTWERGRIVIEGSLSVKILALDENQQPFLMESPLALRGSLEAPACDEGFLIDIFACLREFWFDKINSRQLEVNASIALDVWISGPETFKTIENLCLAEPGTPPKRIPMALYVVGRDDTLWGIAKRYKSDIDTLVQLNQLDPEKPLPEGMKLFVMK